VTIFGFDLSRYDTVGDVQPAFDLLNVEDPGCSQKAHRAHALGITWGLYSWVYPNDQGHSATRSKAMGDLLELDGTGQPPAGHWLDYEQTGVTPQDLVNAFAHGVEHLGVYTYLYIIASVKETIGSRPLWLAYYPGNNDGQYPAGSIGDAQRWGAKLWQYSSTNGNLDRDVVVDEAWWAGWVHGNPKPVPVPRDEDSMYFVHDPDGSGRIWQVGDTRRPLEGGEWAFRAGPFGGNPYSNPPGGAFQALTVSQEWFNNIPIAGASSGDNSAAAPRSGTWTTTG
jgi:hypothetical protein